jgi:hypothetical protein
LPKDKAKLGRYRSYPTNTDLFSAIKTLVHPVPLPTICGLHGPERALRVSRVNTSIWPTLCTLRALRQTEPLSLIDTQQFFILSASMNDLKLLLFDFGFWISRNSRMKLLSTSGH